jgi:phage/plasmid-associated DNA primase
MTAKEMLRFANDTLDILFSSDAEFRSFYLMLQQLAAKEKASKKLLIPVKGRGVRALSSTGELKKPDGQFTPNYLNVEYDPDVDTRFLWETLVDWLDGEEQAHSLLHHLSVGLQPGWTASKYLLLIGKGSNGKSTLLKMIEKLVGRDNTSSVTRQEMSNKKVTVAALNGALMNIVFDGPKEFLKDSSTEKTLIAGERLDLELKYANIATTVQTTALFIEGLQQEPKVSDHSPALQRRLVRYQFPNTYEADRAFERRMVSNETLSALVKLILEHWVTRDEKKGKLLNTAASSQLQLEQQWSTSPLLQFLEYLAGQDPIELRTVVKKHAPVDLLVASYRPWLGANGYKTFDDGYIRQSIDENFVTTRKTLRINGKPSTRRVIVEPTATAQALIDALLEGIDDED